MAYTDIDKPSDYTNTVLYTGNGSTNAIQGVGFQPDFIWCKSRSIGYDHRVFNSISGVGKYDDTGNGGVESSDANSITAFGTDGFTLGSEAGGNVSGQTFVSWNWLAGGTASSNTDGSITSSVSANTTAGFSIVSYTGNGTAGATIGHNLGTAPKVVLVKRRSVGGQWVMGHGSLGFTKFLELDLTGGEQTSTLRFNDTAPTNQVFTVGSTADTNQNGTSIIAYCFVEKKGYSKFSSYVGNGSSDGTFVYTGFKPAWVMIKSNTDASEWAMFDNKRNIGNETADVLRANSSNAETDSTGNNSIDILSNGFKVRGTGGWVGTSGRGFIYMCFASNPFVTSTGIPTTAR